MSETSGVIEQRLADMGIILPRPPKPIGNYLPGVVVGEILYLSGTLGTVPDENDNDIMPIAGKVGADVTIEEGYQSARYMAINHLALMKAVLGDLDRIERIVKMIGYVNCAPGFTEPHLVLNGASDLYVELFGEASGKHARAALTQHELGVNAPVEAELTIQIKV
jgi:enamine deaminase RidA (YjgF/YER057c/UK114 family)